LSSLRGALQFSDRLLRFCDHPAQARGRGTSPRARGLNDVRYVRFPRFKCATLLVEAIVSIVMCGMHTGLGVRENREAVFAGHAERHEARRQRAAKIMRD